MTSSDIETILELGSIAAIGNAFRSRKLSIREATEWYLARIESLNQAGPGLNAVRVVSPHAVSEAEAADRELAGGRDRGPLHGIPVLIKDNIFLKGFPTPAGARALAGFVSDQDAVIVERLRQAGAIILGKTNLTEFGDYVADVMPAEFSALGGVVRNPHGIAYARGQGSSVGSAAAVAAALAPFAIGGETQNSIQTPASYSSVVGFKPSVGMICRAGIIPLVPSQDSPGPLTRSVEDAVTVFRALAGADARDVATMSIHRDLRGGGTPESLAQIRIGVPRRAMADRPEFAGVMTKFDETLSGLARAGATIVDPCDLPSAEQLQEVRSCVFRTEFKAALDSFFPVHGSPCGIGSLGDLVRWNEAHPDAIPYGQSLLVGAYQTLGLDDPVYRLDRARDIALSRTAGIDAALDFAGVDVLVSPMGAAAKCTGKAGSPAISIPAGLNPDGVPFGVTLYCSVGQDERLLAVAHAVEKAVGDRRAPGFL